MLCLKAVFLTAYLAFLAGQVSTQSHVITSGYSTFVNSWDFLDGHLTELREDEWDINLTFLQFDPELMTLYAVHEVSSFEGTEGTGGVSRWKVDLDEDGRPTFTKLESIASIGTGPCHIKVDRNLGFMFVSNYLGGSFLAQSIDKETGAITGDFTNYVSYGAGSNVVPDRQAESHAHGAFVYKNFVYVADLGSDKIWHYKVTETGSVVEAEPAFTETPPGSGPRHLLVDESKGLLYALYELKSQLEIFKINPETGGLDLTSSVNILADSPIPEETWDYPFQTAAELELHPNGKWMYISTRGTGAMLAFEVLDNGDLLSLQFIYTGGTTPRHFKISPDGLTLLVGIQDADLVEVYSIDQESGRLTKIEDVVSKNAPTMVEFLP